MELIFHCVIAHVRNYIFLNVYVTLYIEQKSVCFRVK